ncbi:MAG: PAS domain S-box protein [Dehalococcoidia bacterium]|nr:PAS domain S-box protein [Dehalococcoidia bacterium]
MSTSENGAPGQSSELELCRRRVAALEKQVTLLSTASADMAVQMEGARVLADITVETSRAVTIDDLCCAVGRAVHTLEPDAYVAVNLYEPTEKYYRAVYHFGIEPDALATLRAMGMDLDEMRFTADLKERRRAESISGRLEHLEGGLYELFSEQLPQDACAAAASALGVADVYHVGFAIDDVPYGGITLMLRDNARILHVKTIESLASHAGLVIREKRMVDTLRASEEEFRSLFEQSMDAIFIVAPGGSHIDANPAWLDLFGYTHDEMMRLHATEMYADPEERNAFLRTMAETGQVTDELRFKKKDGTILDCVRTVVTRKNKLGKVVGYQGVVRDVTEQKRAEQSLRDSEERYRLLANNTLDVIWTMDLNTVFTYVNPAIETMLGFTPEEWVGSSLADHATPEYAQQMMVLIQHELEHLESHVGVVFETEILHKDGSSLPFEIHGKVLTDDNGTPVALQGVTRDISQRKKAEEERNRSQWQTAVRNHISGIFLTSADDALYGKVLRVVMEAMDSSCGVFCYVDEHGALVCPSMAGDEGEECRMQDKTPVFPRDTWAGLWGRALTEHRSLCANEGLQMPTGHIPLTRVLDVPLIHRSEVIGNLMVGNKATDYNDADREFMESMAATIAPILDARLLAERALAATRTSSEQMSHLAQRLEEVREEERTNLARELHDTAGQALTALKLDVGQIKKRLAQGTVPSSEELDTLDSVLDRTADDVRRISSQLRPGVLDDIGLEGAIEWQIDEIRKRSDIEFTVSLPEMPCWIDVAPRTALFRVFQELLTNVIRHAHARSVHVSLENVGDACVLTVTDDGSGADLELLENSQSLGIVGMRERLRLYGGVLHYHGATPQGTIARVVLPIVHQ